MKKFFLVIFILFILSSCEKLEYGTVTKKWYEPERTYVQYFPIYMHVGKITTMTMIPYVVTDGADWCIQVQGMGSKGDVITKTFYLTQQQYDTTRVGQSICVNGDCDKDFNNTKKQKN